MLRLLLCLSAGLALAMVMLLLRQQRLEMQNQCNAIHDRMLDTQTRLWSQQLQVAAATAPAALELTLSRHAERDGRPAATNDWADVRGNLARRERVELRTGDDDEWGVLTTP